MLPGYIAPDYKSKAEVRVFEWLNKMNGDYWGRCTAIHSLGVSEHLFGKRTCEIDFLIITPDGIFALEVKGGGVKYDRDKGLWTFQNASGYAGSKREGPLEQVENAVHSLESALNCNRNYHIPKNVAFGWSVVMPDMSFVDLGTDFGSLPCYFASQQEDAFPAYLNRLRDYWVEGQSAQWKRRRRLNEADVDILIDACRPEIHPFTPLWVELEAGDAEAQEITKEQFAILDFYNASNKLLIEGGAGTGKTWLAIEQARMLASEGITSLFICFNSLLASQIKKYVKSHWSAAMCNKVDFFTMHQFIRSCLGDGAVSALQKLTSDDTAFWKEAERKFGLLETAGKVWDSLIVDEGQDIMCGALMDPLGLYLKGGWEGGRWSIFYDSQQLQLASRFEETALDKFKGWAGIQRPHRLSRNLRNTKPICEAVQLFCAKDPGQPKRISDRKAEIIPYADHADLTAKLEDKLAELSKLGNLRSLQDIVILYPRVEMEDLLLKAAGKLNLQAVKVTTSNVGTDIGNRIQYHAIDGFKGLESSVVIILGLSELKESVQAARNYIAFTRARNMLIVFLDEKLQGQVKELAVKMKAVKK